jgi:hypothetical protein
MLIVKKQEHDHDTTKDENSTIGNAKSLMGTQKSSMMLFNGLALGA